MERLERQQIEDMWTLYAGYYERVDRTTFDTDLREKQCVFVGLDRTSGQVRGFSTAILDTHVYRGRRVGVYFSGDTLVEPRYWGQRPFHRVCALMLLEWRLQHPFTRLYWHLICNGYRTFLTLASNFPEYWPHPEKGLPGWERGLIDTITRARFGPKWRPEAGVVRDDVRLKPHVAPFTPEVRRIPAVRFFLERNPGYAEGDELSMVGRVNTGFFVRVSAKLVRSLLRRSFSRSRTPSRKPPRAEQRKRASSPPGAVSVP